MIIEPIEDNEKKANELQKLLTVEDIKYIFSIGRTAAYQLMRSSGFPTMRINNRMYVSREALNEWIKIYSGRKYIF